MAQKMTGALVFDERTDRYDIRFDLASYYGGLHCGDCFDVFTRGKWKPTRIEKILSILVDTFLQGYQCLSCSIHGFIISLSLDHRRKPLIGGAYPPVVPIADKAG